MVGASGFEPPASWSRTRFQRLLKSIESWGFQLLPVESVELLSRKFAEFDCTLRLCQLRLHLHSGKARQADDARQGEPVNFEWDRRGAAQNWRRHGVSFREAATVFGDPLSMRFRTRITRHPNNDLSRWECPE